MHIILFGIDNLIHKYTFRDHAVKHIKFTKTDSISLHSKYLIDKIKEDMHSIE